MGDQRYALQSWKNRNRLVQLSSPTSDVIYTPPLKSRLIEIVPQDPSDPTAPLAVIANQNGQQALWITTIPEITDDLQAEPNLLIPKGAIFDPAWHPSENKLLLTIERDSSMQVYQYEVETRKLSQLTQGTLNAMEAQYSPDGSQLVYVVQEKNERRLATATIDELQPTNVEFNTTTSDQSGTSFFSSIQQEYSQRIDTTQWTPSPYSSSISWLRPRILYPGFERTNGYNKFGVSFIGTDVLQQNSYDLELSYQLDRMWYDFTYRHSGFYPGFDLSSRISPIFINDPSFYLLERRFELGIPVPFRFDTNNRSTSALVRPFAAFNQVRIEQGWNNEAYSDFSHRLTAGLSMGLNYRLQSNPRDIQPNAGWSIFAEAQRDLTVDNPTTEPRVEYPTRQGFQARLSRYLSLPFMRRWNQSLNLTARYLTQSNTPIYNIDPLVSDAFDTLPFGGSIPNNLGTFNARYTIPLAHIDDGIVLLPTYLKSIYLVGFGSTATDLDLADPWSQMKSVVGAGLRSRFQLGAVHFDIGIAMTLRPDTREWNYFVGSF
jgi:hypothetical protein